MFVCWNLCPYWADFLPYHNRSFDGNRKIYGDQCHCALDYYLDTEKKFFWTLLPRGIVISCCPPLSRIVPRFRESVGTLNLIRLSVCLSVCHKNFNLGHNFCTITDRALILGMCVPCDKTFPVVPCRDLHGDLWPSSRSNWLPSGGPQFSEFACWFYVACMKQGGLIVMK